MQIHETQAQYIAAKAHYDAVNAEMTRRLEPHYDLMSTDNGLEQFVDIEMALDDELGQTNAFNALRAAEAAMLKWARGRAEAIASAEQKKTLAYVFENAPRHPAIYAKMVATALQLHPTA